MDEKKLEEDEGVEVSRLDDTVAEIEEIDSSKAVDDLDEVTDEAVEVFELDGADEIVVDDDDDVETKLEVESEVKIEITDESSKETDPDIKG